MKYMRAEVYSLLFLQRLQCAAIILMEGESKRAGE